MKRKDILMILVPIFIIVVFWIGFSIYHGIVSSTISEVENLQITPISPDFDTKTIQGYQEKIFRIRVGDYRILYEIDYEINQIGIIKIDKRSRVYS